MYSYRVGWGSYEESSYRILQHRTEFTLKQLRAVTYKCFEKAYWPNRHEDGETFITTVFCSDEFLEAMKDEGFEEIKFSSQCCEFGWGYVEEPDAWKSDRSAEFTTFLKEIKSG